MIRVFIATGDKWREHEPILEYSIRKHTDAELDVRFIDPLEYGMGNMGCTGFTHVRWALPELCGNDGYCIYLDIDMLLLRDIRDLWVYRRIGKYVCLIDGSTEVMVMDCRRPMPPKEKLHEYGKHGLLQRAKQYLVPTIPLHWNCKDEVNEETSLLHFTCLKSQPWFTPDRQDAAVKVLHEYQNDYKKAQSLGLA